MRPAASAWIALAIVLVVAPGVLGVASRTRALLTRRRGAPVLQSYYDLLKLLRRGSVLSDTTSRVFRAAPVCLVASTILAGAVIPLDGRAALIRFPGDVVALVYALAFGRFLLVLAALDTGSSFEGMGASREVTVASIVELGLFLSFGTLAALTKTSSLSGMLGAPLAAAWPTGSPAILMTAVGLFALMLAECARMPVDDPATHLELTMIHEVMILDHSGPDLALILYSSALELSIIAAIIVTLLAPRGDMPVAVSLAVLAAGLLATGVAIGIVEATVARLRLPKIPLYLASAASLGLFSLVLVLWSSP
ncbi:MAG TPA: NADH-quinone oxidoreductase subunit H [Gemmatimonadaceae bacterium]